MSWNRSRRLISVRSCFVIFATLGIFVFVGCGDSPGDEETQKNLPQKQAKQTQQEIPVAVTSVDEGSISSYYRATATLEAEKQAQVLARITGVVKKLLAEEGDMVSKGDPLLLIDNDEYRFRVEQAAASATNLRSQYKRLEQMVAEGLATEQEIQTSHSDLASAEAEEGLARLSLSYTTVVAPFTGKITQRLVNVGQNISNGDPLFDLADFNPLLAKVHVPSREFKLLQKDQAVELVLDSDGVRLAGRIKLISPVIDPTSGTIKITVEVPDYPQGTRPGEFAQVQIVTEKRDNSTLVPRGAVLTDKGESVVYLPVNVDDKLQAERRVVEVGFSDDLHVQIISGLTPGDTVIIKGQRSLKHGAPLKILEESGH